MAELLVERGRRIKVVELPIHLDALEPLLPQFQHLFFVLALAIPHNGRQQIAARAFLQRHDPVDHILHLLRLDGLAGGGAVGRARAGKQQSQIVVNLGDGADGGARVFRCRLLLDGDCRAQTRNMIHIRLFHHIEELARIGAEGFNVAALPLGIDGVKRKARFARSRQARDHHQFIARYVHVDVLEIVLARAAHLDILQLSHIAPKLCNTHR